MSQFRLKALAHILRLVDEYDIEIGYDEYKETEMKMKMQKKAGRLMTKGRDDMKLALIMMIIMIAGADGKVRNLMVGLCHAQYVRPECHRSLERGCGDVDDPQVVDERPHKPNG